MYIFDTSSFRVLNSYFPEVFPTFWEMFEGAINDGIVVSAREVRRELLSWASDWLLVWINTHQHIFLTPSSEETQFVAEIFQVPHFLALVGRKQILEGKPVADPYLVASARIRNGCVVTEEANKPNAARIPNICEHFGIRCTNVQGFLVEKGWTF